MLSVNIYEVEETATFCYCKNIKKITCLIQDTFQCRTKKLKSRTILHSLVTLHYSKFCCLVNFVNEFWWKMSIRVHRFSATYKNDVFRSIPNYQNHYTNSDVPRQNERKPFKSCQCFVMFEAALKRFFVVTMGMSFLWFDQLGSMWEVQSIQTWSIDCC